MSKPKDRPDLFVFGESSSEFDVNSTAGEAADNFDKLKEPPVKKLDSNDKLYYHHHDWHMLGWEMTKTRMTGNGPVTGVDPIYKATKFVCLTCKKVEEV